MHLEHGGDQFTLTIAGYEFPTATDHWDANWLLIRIELRLATGDRHWVRVDPSLLASEVAGLADWLDSVASGAGADADVDDVIGFIEPNLGFRCPPPARTTLGVRLGAECRPPWADRGGDYWCDFPVSAASLRASAAALREQLARTPPR
ncbi:MAG: hypothetical protein AB7K09_12695 [Planctomycetota bacterium]